MVKMNKSRKILRQSRSVTIQPPTIGAIAGDTEKIIVTSESIRSADAPAYKSRMIARPITTPAPDADTLARLAADLGLDPAPILARMDAPEVAAVIEANHALGKTMEVSGTPTFVVDQTMVRGYVPLDGMRQIVAGQRG